MLQQLPLFKRQEKRINMKVLVFNCGSSSVKYQLFDMPEGVVLAKGLVQRIGEDQSEASQKVGNKALVLS